MSKELYLRKMRPLRKLFRENMTEAETYLWSLIRRKQLGFKFRRQVSIGYFIVDFYCKELSLAIELDGKIHLKKEIQVRDKIRQEIIESDLVTFLRFTNEQVLKDSTNTLKIIKETCTTLQTR